jgi:WD40 repeat protein
VFSPDSEYITVGSSDGVVFIWNVNDPTRLETTLREHDSSVIAVAWQPAGNSLTTSDKNKRVIIWCQYYKPFFSSSLTQRHIIVLLN